MEYLRALIIAGPNGAGKTTFAREFLPKEINDSIFINADMIAAGLSPFSLEPTGVKAGKLMLKTLEERIANHDDFAIETTLSGLGYARMIPEWQSRGYTVELVFLRLPNVEMAISRVKQRVAQGGHNIPEATIHRRYNSG